MSLGGSVQLVIVVLSVYSILYLLNYVYLAFISSSVPRKHRQTASENWPHVSIHIPIYNERYVAGRIIQAISELDYPREKLQLIVVDDSEDDTTAIIEETASRCVVGKIEFVHLRRSVRQGFKGGALQEALKHTKGDFIAVFDADFVPSRDFLKRVLSFFDEEKVGAVQVRWEHLNGQQSVLTRGQALNLDLHFEVEQQARSTARYFVNFNGTAGIWRRRCIEEAGGWRGCLAEDLELSVRAHLKGWRIVYVSEPSCPGEVPPQMQAAKRQQYRWAYGAIETAKLHLLNIMRSHLSLGVKVQSFFHLTRHIPQLMFLAILMLTPVAILANVPSGNALLSASWALISAAVVTAKLGTGRLREFPYMVLFTTSMTVNNSLAVLDALRGRRREFYRTPKFGEGEWRGKKYVLPLDAQSYFEIAFGLWLLILSILSSLKLLLGYTVYLVISGVSILYAGALSLHHSPKGVITMRSKRLKSLRLLITAIIAAGLITAVSGYYQTYYRLDYASGYLARGASSSDAGEIAGYIEKALEILPETGNPVWIFPTPRTDFSLITKDLQGLLTTASSLTKIQSDSPTYQQGLDQLKDSLKTIREQVSEAAPFYLISPLSLILATSWLAALAYVLKKY
ncbi:MAG: glycosyltransferase [Candidatus Caldarchaeum sp.]|nr:glycosyltransferase [Candidatus Caldarchaeum sp.]MDW7978193.1 glycosyltransferase [Candidatus Caldarchaeum sp.]